MAPERIFLKKGLILDPASDTSIIGNVLIEDGIIKAIGENLPEPDGVEIVNCEKQWILPGFVDLHVHFSEPKRYDRETVKSLSEAATAGGVTTALVRSSSDLVIDDVTVIEFIYSRSRKIGKLDLLPVAAMTRSMNGEKLTEFGEMGQAGAVAVGDDGRSVMSSAVMRRGMEYAKDNDLTVFAFPQDKDLAAGGYMNEGAVSSLFGIKGIPYSAEEVMVTRDIILARMTGAHVHVSPVTTAGSVELIRRAKKDGINVTSDTSPHYFIIDENAVEGYNTDAKVLPPLRRARDIAAIRQGLSDGTIDAVTSGHEPLSVIDKDTAFAAAEFGISGVELLAALCYTKLVREDGWEPLEFVRLLTHSPSRITGLGKGELKEGKPADVVVFDPYEMRTIARSALRSRGKNTPFVGWELRGFPTHVIYEGRVVFGA